MDKIIETKTIKKINDLIQNLNYDPKDVLIVLDIDDTLLKMNQYLGSTAWFNHHKNLLELNLSKTFKTLQQLYTVQGLLFEKFNMTKCEDDSIAILQKLKSDGHDIIMETARNLDYHSFTERELDNNGFSFLFDNNSFHINGIWKSDGNKKVSFKNNIFSVHGQNKGDMLFRLLNKKIKNHYKLIIVIDDVLANIHNFINTLSNCSTVKAIHYIKEQEHLDIFYNNQYLIRQTEMQLYNIGQDVINVLFDEINI
jgi:hypothetical protein